MNLLFCLLVGLGLVSGNFHPLAQTAKIPKTEGLKRLRRNREGNTWLTNGIHWLIGTYLLLKRTRTRTKKGPNPDVNFMPNFEKFQNIHFGVEVVIFGKIT